MLPIHVISLRDAADRREKAAAQLEAQSVDFSFFDALDGTSGAALFERCDEEAFVLHTGRVTTQGEIGCYASHKALWQKCANEDRSIMIMEDDFKLSADFSKAVALSELLVDELGLLRLQDERRGNAKPVMTVGDFQLERYTKTPHCAMCYALTPALARRMLQLFRVYYAPVDVVMKHVWLFDNPMYCLTPYTVTGSDLSFESIIGDRNKCKKSLATRVRRTLLKIDWQWQRLKFNLAQSDDEVRRRCAGRVSTSGIVNSVTNSA
ncbi:MAG: glycosyltransferase family 25 protein [Woeseia sp.]